ncbi:MAG: rhodanese-like domain-containing protein [Phycisphaerae bacterium]|jgi:rhodanese-related sulfurtransferase|nr:rhodanese-like domain-containing protein [Phycisphaerae bacterium]HOO15960.1 rhodanese-like domain-containing protein [Phycisphaerae bacterium]HPC22741.1 rhodanese-like domain-containing protein [Phycisphaerae bacterium]HRS27644.1 rhodanese-like domain-containing protein [Phycisphaerae bacterium]HRT40983.1 rhodanese-like domain-containing protein [Phycisphaerae bacterium]
MPRALSGITLAAVLVCAGCAARNGQTEVRGHEPEVKSRQVGFKNQPQRDGTDFESVQARGAAVHDSDGALVGYRLDSAPDPLHEATLAQVRECVLHETGVLIDVRPAEFFARGHLRGALNLPAGPADQMDLHLEQIRASIDPGELIILYCSGPGCGSAHMVSEYLGGHGFTNTLIYSPGWKSLAAEKDLH